MFILRDLLTPLQQQFSDTAQGQKRSVWFVYTLLAVVIPFTSSITSNLLRALQTLFGLTIQSQRFYTFMASTTLPWERLWHTLWALIPEPLTEGRLVVVVDDTINPKCGRKIFGCGHFHDHAAKGNQTTYPWSQCIVAIGLLKQVKSRWACLPLDFRFYLMDKDIKAQKINAERRGKTVPFQSKMDQAAATRISSSGCWSRPIAGLATMVCGRVWRAAGTGTFICCHACVPISRCMRLRR